MQKWFTLSFSLLLVIGFQNCGQPQFSSLSSQGEILVMPYECSDTVSNSTIAASCAARSFMLGRYAALTVTQISYADLGGYPLLKEIANTSRYGVNIELDHSRAEIRVKPWAVGTFESPKAAYSMSTPIHLPEGETCALTFGSKEYHELVELLVNVSLAPVDPRDPEVADGGVSRLTLTTSQKIYQHVFRLAENVRTGDVIVNGDALQAKLRDYREIRCPVIN